MKTAKNVKMMKTLGLFLAFIMLLTLPINVFADGEKAKITISAPDRLVLAASDFSAYKLFDLISKDGTKYAYAPAQPSVDNFLDWAAGYYDAKNPAETSHAKERSAPFPRGLVAGRLWHDKRSAGNGAGGG